MNENKNPHRGSNFNEYKFECLMEDAKKLVEALKDISVGKKQEDVGMPDIIIASRMRKVAMQALEEFKANWDIK